MLYYAQGDAIVNRAELYEKIHTGELTNFYRDLSAGKTTKMVHFSTGDLTGGNAGGWKPVGIGLPLTIMIRQIYTGKYPESIFGLKKDMLVTSAVKSITSFDAKPRAINILMDNVSTNSHVYRPAATGQGTPFVFYSPALVENSLTLDLSIVFDGFPQPLFTMASSAFQSAAGIPIFLPYSTYLLAASGLVNAAGIVGEAVFDGKPKFSTSEGLDFCLPGSDPIPSGFALITDQNVDQIDPDFLKKYKVNEKGQVVDQSGQPYKGDIPFMVISLDGAVQKELESFSPTAASAAMLSRFYGIKDGQQQSFDSLIEAVKTYNDLKYRLQVDTLDKQILQCTDAKEKEELTKKREALAKNIITELLKKE